MRLRMANPVRPFPAAPRRTFALIVSLLVRMVNKVFMLRIYPGNAQHQLLLVSLLDQHAELIAMNSLYQGTVVI